MSNPANINDDLAQDEAAAGGEEAAAHINAKEQGTGAGSDKAHSNEEAAHTQKPPQFPPPPTPEQAKRASVLAGNRAALTAAVEQLYPASPWGEISNVVMLAMALRPPAEDEEALIQRIAELTDFSPADLRRKGLEWHRDKRQQDRTAGGASGAKENADNEAAQTARTTSLPENYKRILEGNNLLIYTRVKSENTWREIPVCTDFDVVSRVRDDVGGGWGIEIEFEADDGTTKSVVVPSSMLQGDGSEARKLLASAGLWISTNRQARDAFQRLINTWTSDTQVIMLEKTGFHTFDDTEIFLAPSGQVIREHTWFDGEDDETKVLPDKAEPGEPTFRSADGQSAHDKAPKGTYTAWKEGVGDKVLQNQDTPHFALGVFTGVAATVMQRANIPACRLHIMGPSSMGKTTSQLLGASMWTSPTPDKGVLASMRNTDNALEARFARTTGCGIHFDEAKTGQEKVVSNIAFLLAAEAGKGRLRPDGTPRPVYTWPSLFATLSSEKAFTHYIARAGDQLVTGNVVRMPSVDISGLQPIDPDEARAFKEAAMANYGHVGPRFAKYLMQFYPPEKLRKMIDDYDKELAEDQEIEEALGFAGLSPAGERARRVFAILGVAGEILIRMGALKGDKYDVLRVCRWAFLSFMNTDEAAALDPGADSVDKLLVWLRSNPGVVRPVGDRDAYREIVAWYDEDTVYIPTTHLAKIPALTTSPQATLIGLEELGVLLRGSEKNRAFSAIPKVGRIANYRLKLQIEVGLNAFERAGPATVRGQPSLPG